MKNILMFLALTAGGQAALLTADLVGFPGNYGLYRGQELVLAFDHSGRFAIDTDTGQGALTLNFVIAGGSEADLYGGVGTPLQRGATRISMTLLDVAMLWSGLLALPDQPYYFGGDTATQIPVEIIADCIPMGALDLGCGSSMHLMGALYMTQGKPAFNLWLDWSMLGGGPVYSGDAVFALRDMETTHTPEPGSMLLVALGLLCVIGGRVRR